MEAEEFLRSAEILIKGNQEVDYRNAASRAYYSAFHLCRNFLDQHPKLKASFGAVHEKVIHDFLSNSDKRFQKIGKKLEQAKRLRHAADYKLVYQFVYYTAKQTIDYSCKIKTELEIFQNSRRF